MDIHFQMPPVHVHVKRAIRIALAKYPITIGGHAQLLNLFLERADLLFRLLQGPNQFFVLFFPLA